MKTFILIALTFVLNASVRADVGVCKIQLCPGAGAKVILDGLSVYDSCNNTSPVLYADAIKMFNHLIITNQCGNINPSRCAISNCKGGAMVEFDGGVMIDKCTDSLNPKDQAAAKMASIKTFSSLMSAGECR